MLYAVDVEFGVASNDLAENEVEGLIDELAPWHGAIGTSAFGNAEALLSVLAEDLPHALATIRLVLLQAGLETLRVEVLPREIFDKRAGQATIPELVTAREAADLLGVSRPAVVGMIERGELPRLKIGERGTAIPVAAVERLRERRAERARTATIARPA